LDLSADDRGVDSHLADLSRQLAIHRRRFAQDAQKTGFRSMSPRMLTRSSLGDHVSPSHRVPATSLASALVFALVQASLGLSFDQDGTQSGLIDRSRPSFSTKLHLRG